MKWFQLDADMPDDPKVRAVIRALDGAGLPAASALGGLVGVWCHVAKHGRRPGVAVDSRGAPLPIEDLAAASLLPGPAFEELVAVCLRTGHFQRDADGRITIPAMTRRADRYSRRCARAAAPGQPAIEWAP